MMGFSLKAPNYPVRLSKAYCAKLVIITWLFVIFGDDAPGNVGVLCLARTKRLRDPSGFIPAE
jgi:hypothetical protein